MTDGPLTPNDIKTRLDVIRQVAYDPDAAHFYQDDLYVEVLNAIALDNTTDPRECAALALHANDIDFPRWYA